MWEAVAEGISEFNPQDESQLSLKSKLSNLYKRHPGREYLFKYFRKQYYPRQHSNEEQVAIKCLPEGSSEKDYNDMANELKLMTHIGHHQNIVNLLGACTINGPLWLILEYCPHGDLLTFLRSRKELVPEWGLEDDLSSREILCLLDLMKRATDICDGMCFLSSQGKFWLPEMSWLLTIIKSRWQILVRQRTLA